MPVNVDEHRTQVPRWVGYAVTIFLEWALTVGLTLLLRVFPAAHFPIPYVLLTMAIAYFFGEGPAVLSIVLGWAAFTYYFVPPAGFWPIADSPEGWARELAFLLGVIAVSIVMVQVSKSHRRILQLADESTALNASLREEISDRKRAEEEVKTVNAELEQRVAKRTAELEDTVKELEAFSYSISHDLRAPLRAVDGFSNTLLKMYGEQLDERGQDYLRRVRAAAVRMGLLIDDIQGLSRAGRAEMHRQPVDISAMARDILDELRRSEPERKAEIVIAQDLIVDADHQLLRIALDNLLGNAWKFTSKRDVARIELSAVERSGERVYCVRDNGAGFNPAYKDKLFSAFQRLHTEAEFPGSGIGLALVQRIMRRHSGKVWAEGAVDEGATFCFTLGEADG